MSLLLDPEPLAKQPSQLNSSHIGENTCALLCAHQKASETVDSSTHYGRTLSCRSWCHRRKQGLMGGSCHLKPVATSHPFTHIPSTCHITALCPSSSNSFLRHHHVDKQVDRCHGDGGSKEDTQTEHVWGHRLRAATHRKGPKGQKPSSRVPSKGRCRYELEGCSVGQTQEGQCAPMSHLSRLGVAVGQLSAPESPAGSDSACGGCCGYPCRCA